MTCVSNVRGVVQGCLELKTHKAPICLLPSPSTKGASVFGRHTSQLGSLNLLHPVCVSLASGGTGCHCAPRSRIITAVCRSPRQAGGVPLASGVSRRDGEGLDALPLWPSETKKGIDEESVAKFSVPVAVCQVCVTGLLVNPWQMRQVPL